MTTVTGVTIGTSDTTAPSPVSVLGTAVEGAFDDTVSVVFDDDMIESEIENPANWTVESPIGTSLVKVESCRFVDSPKLRMAREKRLKAKQNNRSETDEQTPGY